MTEAQLRVEPYRVCARSNGWLRMLRWNVFDETTFISAEKTILEVLKTPYRGYFVGIRGVAGPEDKIWTVSLNEESKRTPIVLLHGLASGVALWCRNLDDLAANRPVHAVDVLGFARSSRPKFSNDANEAESQLVEALECWRGEMKLDKFILMGHSFGGFQASAYALKYPDRVKHLILADSWGYPSRPSEDDEFVQKIPFWAKPVVFLSLKFHPLTPLRAIGPLGPWAVPKFRHDLLAHFEPVLKEKVSSIGQYVLQSNIQYPSGEMAFKTISDSLRWARNPMINRIGDLRWDVPLTVILGGRSWIESSSGDAIKEKRPFNSFCNVQIIDGAGHHLYAEKADQFNKLVNEACRMADQYKDI